MPTVCDTDGYRVLNDERIVTCTFKSALKRAPYKMNFNLISDNPLKSLIYDEVKHCSQFSRNKDTKGV